MGSYNSKSEQRRRTAGVSQIGRLMGELGAELLNWPNRVG